MAIGVALKRAVAKPPLDAEDRCYVLADAPVYFADVLADAAWCTNPLVLR
eukprot:CAMPEP_0198552838 /NCGR_PEP_ID=MMETSP1462-20131121/79349_1 /TAXON_ID=1333877 /ORGANISM="Brandtodinium nutriculum, Strain RCC3387" /LENGTH=49 /DNA_ID= /DNA_START= /DNA_END= /DNA_ORIENTATION=